MVLFHICIRDDVISKYKVLLNLSMSFSLNRMLRV